MFVNNVSVSFLFLFSRPTADARVLMICCVLVGGTYVPKEMFARSLIVPPDHADTTVSVCRNVYVKYNDYEFYPLYFVYYRLRREHLIGSKFFRGNNRRTQMQIEYLDRYCKPVKDLQAEMGEFPPGAASSINDFDGNV